ncbi:MAG: DUF1735 domain-containing protein [Bacteroidetes bacterium]|nr:MAG: DUF1735 domain-containing protein [Bacteroidota bacterium]
MRNKIFKITFFLAVTLIISSCLKDNVGEDWTSTLKGKMYAEIWNGGFQSMGLAPVPDAVTFRFLVNIASDKPPTQDITVTIAVNSAALDSYNALKGTSYLLYPYIEVLDPSLTIKAGTRNAYAHVKVWNADQLNACDNYVAPISIMDATGGVIPADPLNVGSRLMGLPISNPYAGDYHVVGYRKHPTAGIFTVDKTETLSTIDCKTVTKNGFGDYPYDVTIQVTTNTIIVGGVTCYKVIVHTIDPGTGAFVAGETQYDTFTGVATQVPIPVTNDVNYYNPVEKKFVLNMAYNAAAPRIAYEVLTKE